MDGKAEIVEESTGILPAYARIPISYDVRSVLEVQLLEDGLGGIRLSERPVVPPWVKDYDALKGEGPTRWAKRWDVAKWGVLSAFVRGCRVGGCVIAHDTPGVHQLEDRKDIAAVWDIRVSPPFRGQGVGGRLIDEAIAWASRRECCLLKVETQNVNVPACRLYVRHGFTLGAINRYAYPELPEEVELIWCREL